MLDDVHWPTTTALIDEACGLTSNALLVGEGPKDDLRVLFVGLYYRGQRRENLEREDLEVYHPIEERVPRLRQLPDATSGLGSDVDSAIIRLPRARCPVSMSTFVAIDFETATHRRDSACAVGLAVSYHQAPPCALSRLHEHLRRH